jgi:hypothetical protein
MNCKIVRDQLLQAERPERPTADLAAHLGQCPPCRQWHHRLVQLEREVPLLPVPPSQGKAALFERLVGERIAPRPRPAANRPSRWKALFQSPALPPAALAASLLLFAGLWWYLEARPREKSSSPQPSQVVVKPPPRDPLLADLMQHNVKLAQARTAKDRLLELAAMADRLHGATQTLAGEVETADLAALARWYTEVVDKGIVVRADALRRAPDLRQEERKEVLAQVANRLKQTETEAGRHAQAAQTTATAEQWQRLASAARGGADKLRALLGQEDKP